MFFKKMLRRRYEQGHAEGYRGDRAPNCGRQEGGEPYATWAYRSGFKDGQNDRKKFFENGNK